MRLAKPCICGAKEPRRSRSQWGQVKMRCSSVPWPPQRVHSFDLDSPCLWRRSIVQEPPPRCCPKQPMLQVEALRRGRKSGVQASPWGESSAVAMRSAHLRVEAWTKLFKRLVPSSRGRITFPWSSCQTSISSGVHCSRAMINRQCMTYPVAATQGSLAV
eukprot:5194623-Amphidinium_carterae.5